MKELWTTNPFHLVNGPFAEMGYSSSEPNIVPAHLLLAIRTPLAAPPRAASASPLRATRRPPHAPSARFRRSICCLSATHSTASGGSLQAICQCPRAPPSVGPLHSIRHLTANHPPSRCTPSSSPLRNIHRPPAQHPPSHGAASGGPCAPSADSLQAICWHEPMSLTTRRTNRRHEPTP